MVPEQVTATLALHGQPAGLPPVILFWVPGFASVIHYLDDTVVLTTKGDIAALPAGIWRRARRHLDSLGVVAFDTSWSVPHILDDTHTLDYHVRWGVDGERHICPAAIAQAAAVRN